jgi:phosphoglycerate kinase
MNALPLPVLDGVNLRGKRVLVRADLNVPMDGGQISDATRITRFLPTLADLIRRGARVLVMSHAGRPKGYDPKHTLAPVAVALAEGLERPVTFLADWLDRPRGAADAIEADGSIALLENLRFHAGEERNDPDFARRLAALGDIYVNDAFSCAHRAHASTYAVAFELPAFAGPSLVAEICALERALTSPLRLLTAVVGGSKVSSKLAVLSHLVGRVDKLVIGGGMANTFLAARGIATGRSLQEPDLHASARDIEARARAAGCSLLLPSDAVVARTLEPDAVHRIAQIGDVADDEMILDVGPASVRQIAIAFGASRTLLWNGPLGVFEVKPFGEGTFAAARVAAQCTRRGLLSIAGGGDTMAALNAAGVAGDFSYVSTAGGAFLEWLEGRELPGIAALTHRAPLRHAQ